MTNMLPFLVESPFTGTAFSDNKYKTRILRYIVMVKNAPLFPAKKREKNHYIYRSNITITFTSVTLFDIF